MRLASEVNRYLDEAAPWFEIKSDRNAAAKSIYTALRAVDSIKILLAPFLPFSSEQLHGFLGYEQPIFGRQAVQTLQDSLGEHDALCYLREGASGRWEPSDLQPGAAIRNPAPLFKKLDESVAEAERARLGTRV